MKSRTVMPFIISIAVAAAPAQAFGAAGKTAVIKNTLGEEISMAGSRSSQAKEEKQADPETMCKQIAVLLEKYVVGTITQDEKTELQGTLKKFGKLNPEEKKQLMVEIDNSPILKLALDSFRESESGKPKLKEWLTAIISVNKAANDGRINELVDKNNAVFVATIVMLRGDAANAAEIIDGNARATIFFFKYALQKVDGFAGALAFSESYSGLENGLAADAKQQQINRAKEALNVKFGAEGTILTKEAVLGVMEAAGMGNASTGTKVSTADVKPVPLKDGLTEEETAVLNLVVGARNKTLKTWMDEILSSPNDAVKQPYYYSWNKLNGNETQLMRGFIAVVSAAKNKGTKINQAWLEQQLESGAFDRYFKQELGFQANDAASAIKDMTALDVCNINLTTANVINMLVADGPVEKLDDKQPVNAERTKTAGILFDDFIAQYAGEQIVTEQGSKTLAKMLEQAKGEREEELSLAEKAAVIQEFLAGRLTLEPGFKDALTALGIAKIETDGAIDMDMLTAMAAYYALKAGKTQDDIIETFTQKRPASQRRR